MGTSLQFWSDEQRSDNMLKVCRVKSERAQCGSLGDRGTASGGDREACRTRRIRHHAEQRAVQLKKLPVGTVDSLFSATLCLTA